MTQELDREKLEQIAECDPSLLLMDIKQNSVFDAAVLGSVFDLAKAQARAALATPAPLSDEPVAIYQMQLRGSDWADVEKRTFDDLPRIRRRIVYAAPLANGGGELMSDDEIDLLADQYHTTFIFGKVNRLRSFARALESRVLAERKPVAWMNPKETFVQDAFLWTRDQQCHPEYSVPLFTNPDQDAGALLAEARKYVAGYTHDVDNPWLHSALALLERIDRARQSGEEGKS
jgi:hypothetical protein